ncbi:MAG TPA: hypothetical protein VGF36_05125, partial [Rhodopila sp.]
VNVASVLAQTGLSAQGMLNAALDLAATEDAASQQSGNSLAGLIQPNTGVFDWFQLNGNTYVVEAVNSNSAASTHVGLAAGDAVVKLAGLVDLSQSTLTQNNGITTLHI